jgi:hypothetical protein
MQTENLLLSRSGVLKLCGGCDVHGCIWSLTFCFNSGLFYAACSLPELPKDSNTEGIIYWQVRTVLSLMNPPSVTVGEP